MATLTEQLAALATMSPAQLRSEWRRVFRSSEPQLTPDLLMRGIAYRLQERALGGLPTATVSLLEKAARQLSKGEDIDQLKRQHLKPGTRLVRSWNGKTYSVLVTNEGFELGDRRFTSLTHIAKEITGAHWSGPRFFGTSGSKGTTGAAATSAKRRASAALATAVTTAARTARRAAS